ncbi:two-component response regulator-like PRR73 [Diospyros lotus]|uniref:two-component response regulator-like PRR73 n=1 Tax=Diospyros lotus TaxID=55363 RepID=UPI00224FB052|nr:two-component response regulator-like PRR73 [Diospyros lotus]
MVGFAELDFHAWDQQKGVRDRIGGEGQVLSEEDESRINEDAEGAKFGPMQLVRSQAVPQILQQHPEGPQGLTVCWERFLPLRSLKILLVENDDSTRHVVSALLRNCSYEVTAVANILEAWKVLEDLTSHIDLVLAEVVMPFLSGIALLCRIMNHKTCKNIPVIMMSSNDSMGIVFKCLSKGAVDFLVKPIRKNELKNLWQHVWRKCHSFSGSGSESGIRTQNSTWSKSIEESDNDTDSNDEDDNASIGLNFRDGSDNGIGTQTSWTKQAVEVENPKCMSPWNQLADPPDSTCAQVVHSRAEAFSNQVPTMATKEYNREDCMNGDDAIGEYLQREVPRSPDLQLEEQGIQVLVSVAEANEKKTSDLESREGDEKLERVKLEINGETRNGEYGAEAADFIGTLTNCSNLQMENVAKIPSDISISNCQVKAIYEAEEMPSLELSLKRQRDIEENEPGAQERNVLRRSNLSAFSRYNTNSTANQASAGNVGICSLVDNSSETAKTETIHNLQSHSNGIPNQGSNGTSNNSDMGSTTNNAYTRPPASGEKSMLKSAVNIHPCSAFQPVKDGYYVSSRKSLIPYNIDAATMNGVLAQAKGMPSHIQHSHNHQHYLHHHYHIHDMQQQQKLPNLNELSGPFSFSSSKTENGSGSGSNNGSNGQNGSSCAIGDGTNRGSDGSGGGSGSGSGVDQNRSARREAALKKFREKRKERCFKKKVRYQSRKTLAEQRPRVRGQFARQSHVR